MTRQQIITEARSYLQTRFHLQGRVKGVGIDCVGLIVGLCQTFNIPHEDCKTYDHNGKGADLLSYFRRWLVEIPFYHKRSGDVLALWIRHEDQPCHAGIYVREPIGPTMIHTHQGIDKVCEHRLSGEWARRICAAFKLPGVED